MPANRKPTAMLEASGAFQANPARARKNEPNTGRGIGPYPATASVDPAIIWDEIVSNCAPGVFQSSDRLYLETLSNVVAKCRMSGVDIGTEKCKLLVNMLARCGMSPSDRSRVIVPTNPDPEKPKVGLAKYL